MYVPPRSEVWFGDIFALEYLHDVFLRADAVALGTREIPSGLVAYSSHYAGRHDQRYLLAHGSPHHAILLSDNCVIETAFGREGAGPVRSGRLLFGAITPAGDADIERLEERPTFGRFPLPAGENFAGGIVELRRCFMVDTRDVDPDPGQRVVSLTEDFAEELEIRWNAYVARRGPFVAVRTAEKLAAQMAGNAGADPSADVVAKATLVANVVAHAWRFEGRDLDAVSIAMEEGSPIEPVVATLKAGLRELAAAASAAADGLAEYQTSSGSSEHA
jgi:hypothetical protein